MKPVMQTKFSSEDGSVRGNCFAACIASLLEIPLAGIPAWEDMGGDGSWGDSFLAMLDEHGYDYEGYWVRADGMPIDASVGSPLWKYLASQCPGVDGYYIIGGKSPRLHVTRGHAVIYKDGVLVHDPHPSGDGLLEIDEVYLIQRKEMES